MKAQKKKPEKMVVRLFPFYLRLFFSLSQKKREIQGSTGGESCYEIFSFCMSDMLFNNKMDML